MKKVLKLVLFCSLFFYSFSVSAQTLEEYLHDETVRIQQAQSTETVIENYITNALPGYNLSQADINTIISNAQAEGNASQSVIDAAIINTKRYQLRQQYFNQNPGVIPYYTAIVPPQPLRQTCINGGFEIGWQGYTFNSVQNMAMVGCNTPPAANAPVIPVINNPNAMVSLMSRFDLGFVPNEPTLATAGVTNVPTVLPGSNRSIKLNNNTINDYSVTTMSRVLQITDPLLEYRFSFISQNPLHPPTPQNPFLLNPIFKVTITDANGQITTLRCITGFPDCIFTAAGTDLLYTGWQCDQLNVANFIGQTVTIDFTVGDCFYGGHFATVYIDDICNFTCNNSAFGLLQLNAVSNDCAPLLNNNPYQVCGTFTPPLNSTLTDIAINMSVNGAPFQPIANTTVAIAGNTFCITIPASAFGTLTNGNIYQFQVTANYMQTCNTITANSSNTAFATVTFTNCCLPTLTLSTANADDVVASSLPAAVRLRETKLWTLATNRILLASTNPLDQIIYTSENWVVLDPGFEAVAGSQFAAYIQNCPGGTFTYRPVKNNSAETNVLPGTNGISIYPNPANNIVEIVANKEAIKKISLFTIDGKRLLEKNFDSGNRCKIDVSPYMSGLYFVNIILANGQSYLRKLVKN